MYYNIMFSGTCWDFASQIRTRTGQCGVLRLAGSSVPLCHALGRASSMFRRVYHSTQPFHGSACLRRRRRRGVDKQQWRYVGFGTDLDNSLRHPVRMKWITMQCQCLPDSRISRSLCSASPHRLPLPHGRCLLMWCYFGPTMAHTVVQLTMKKMVSMIHAGTPGNY